ncbi:MAG: hypothetical protein KAR44_07685 [Candidatus Aegiribacteria sp.]|nr:hypothetical protein [Candidatus Aegiribacteria sp.]
MKSNTSKTIQTANDDDNPMIILLGRHANRYLELTSEVEDTLKFCIGIGYAEFTHSI